MISELSSFVELCRADLICICLRIEVNNKILGNKNYERRKKLKKTVFRYKEETA